jgi:hypothetical protein
MGERGVSAAKKECVPRYLDRVLALSPASLIIVYGDQARNAIRARFDYSDIGVFPSRPAEVAGVKRRFAFLAYPTATNPKRPTRLPETELADAREWLSGTRSI